MAHTVFLKLPAIRWASEDPEKNISMALEGFYFVQPE
jgi:hypothetical protein